MVVLVQPGLQGVAAFLLAAVAAGVGPPVGHGAVESLDFPVGLRAVRPRALRCDREFLAGIAPQEGAVRAAIVRQDAFDGDAAVGEPVDRPVQDGDGGDGGLVVVDFGVRDAGVVVDDGVHERVPQLGVVPLAAGVAWGGRAVLLALAAADITPAASVGDVPELLHIHVHERPGVVMLVTADRFACGAIYVCEPVQPSGRENSMHGGRRDAEPARELDRPFAKSQAQAHAALGRRLARLVRRGLRSRGPVVHRFAICVAVYPPLHCRPGHLEASGDLADRPAVIYDKASDFEAVAGSQSGICVGHGTP